MVEKYKQVETTLAKGNLLEKACWNACHSMVLAQLKESYHLLAVEIGSWLQDGRQSKTDSSAPSVKRHG
jgi:hypothetical protein